jgi:hypothetical protein
MTSDSIKWGETYDISAAAADADGVAIPLDGTWSAAIRITRERVGGEVVAEPAMTIGGGVATCTLDTGDDGWRPGIHWYDIRLTDPDGNDYWSEAVKLTLENRNAPASTEIPN